MRQPQSIVILGAGGFGRGVLDVVDALNVRRSRFRVLGFLDPDSSALPDSARPGRVVIGVDADLAAIDARYVISVADPPQRRRLDQMALEMRKSAAPALVHPTCSLGADVLLGEGVVLTGGVRVASNVRLGRHTHVNFNSSIGHDAVLGNYVTVFPQVAISGYAVLSDGVTMGTASAVLPGIHIGAGTTVGAGAVVIRDVPAGVTVAGMPATLLVSRSKTGH
jgi:sugar O-acyltransferase (sialic acid O-acetyltransferase NeuD family)